MMLITIALLVVLAVMASAQIPCDDAYGQHCPEAAGWEVGECLKKVEADLPQDCKNYITMTETCKADIETHCTGKEYTGDALGKLDVTRIIEDPCADMRTFSSVFLFLS